MIMSAEDDIDVWNSIREVSILIVPHMGKCNDDIASEIVFEMSCSSLGKLTPILVIKLALVLVR